jgi:hypothetical protein
MTRRELRRENDELRAALRLRGLRTIEEWESLPQWLRDPLAARAWIGEWGEPTYALIRLGFPAVNQLPPDKVGQYKDHVARVFETPGAQAIIKRDLRRLDADREAILSRQCQIALYADAAESVRAAELIAKVCGWGSRGGSPPATAPERAICLNRVSTAPNRANVMEAIGEKTPYISRIPHE